jgi:hypothetical protein
MLCGQQAALDDVRNWPIVEPVHVSCCTAGGGHCPLVIACSGQYARMYSEKSPLGAGSPFAC